MHRLLFCVFLAAATASAPQSQSGLDPSVGDRMMARRPIDTAAACDFAVKLILGGIPALPRLREP